MRSIRSLTTTAALVLAWAATPAMAAADSTSGTSPTVGPNPDEQVLVGSAGHAQFNPTASSRVQPNPDQQNATGATTSGGPRSEVASGGGYGSVSIPPVVVRVTAPSSGFDWGDAGIGAAGGIAISLLTGAGALALSHRRGRRAAGSPALPR